MWRITTSHEKAHGRFRLDRREKRRGGDIIDLLIRACFIQGPYDERIKTMVKTKGFINTPMAQLVEIALEEECAIKSERFKRNFPERGQFKCRGTKKCG
jgi:hypothetical protein